MAAINEWLVDLAEEAGRIALEYRAKGFEVITKPDGSPVTTADLAIDRFIHDEISSRYPNDCVLSEETPDDLRRTSASRVWIADPIDGTVHFAAGGNGFGILIALCVDGISEECVANFPALNVMLYAKVGVGAFVNGREVRVSSLGIDRAKVATHAQPYLALHTAPTHPRNNAVAVFKVITGEIEGAICATTSSTGEHDYAWASCAVAAAGGRVTDVAGAELRYNKPERRMPSLIVVSNGMIHEELLQRVRRIGSK